MASHLAITSRPYKVDQDGKRLHCWRVLILPYLDEEALYGDMEAAAVEAMLTKDGEETVKSLERKATLER